MTENHPLLLTQAQEFAMNLINAKVNKSVTFHTVQHTQEVVAACELIASSMQLSIEDHEALIIAAWFHDTGYSSGQAKNHESASIQIATDFLKDHHAPETLTNKVVGCINATRMPQNPTTVIEQILCDADLSHLGMNSFREKSRLLREELQLFGNESFSKKEWKQNNISFLVAHKYFTPYAQENFQPFKERHLADLQNKKN